MTKRGSLSSTDKKILKVMLASRDGARITSKAIANKLGIPATTAQRRRNRLEKELLTIDYGLNLHAFGLHEVEFLVATTSGKTLTIGRTLLKLPEVTYVARSIGQHTIDLRVQTVLKDNADILQMSEMIKGMEGVKDVMWSEIVQVVGKKSALPLHFVDIL